MIVAGPQPRRGCVHGRSVPKVARSSQPWAEGHNPLGIELPGLFSKIEMRPANFKFKSELDRNLNAKHPDGHENGWAAQRGVYYLLGRLSAHMKAWHFIILVAVFLTGCGHRDPIDRVVRQASANPWFGNGLFMPIRLPATATPQQLTSAAFKQDISELCSVTNIIESRKVQIIRKGMPKDIIDEKHIDYFTYAAVLVDTDVGRKVVLFHYFDGGKDKKAAGWWHQVYHQ